MTTPFLQDCEVKPVGEVLECQAGSTTTHENSPEPSQRVVRVSVRALEPMLRACQICGPGGAGY
jgi:hypothetical protein